MSESKASKIFREAQRIEQIKTGSADATPPAERSTTAADDLLAKLQKRDQDELAGSSEQTAEAAPEKIDELAQVLLQTKRRMTTTMVPDTVAGDAAKMQQQKDVHAPVRAKNMTVSNVNVTKHG